MGKYVINEDECKVTRKYLAEVIFCNYHYNMYLIGGEMRREQLMDWKAYKIAIDKCVSDNYTLKIVKWIPQNKVIRIEFDNGYQTNVDYNDVFLRLKWSPNG